jgi:hypothetical protein
MRQNFEHDCLLFCNVDPVAYDRHISISKINEDVKNFKHCGTEAMSSGALQMEVMKQVNKGT